MPRLVKNMPKGRTGSKLYPEIKKKKKEIHRSVLDFGSFMKYYTGEELTRTHTYI